MRLITDTSTTDIYTLSLHDALPIFDSDYYLGNYRLHIFSKSCCWMATNGKLDFMEWLIFGPRRISCFCTSDRKSTRLNSSHVAISYAVFCLKKKKRT